MNSSYFHLFLLLYLTNRTLTSWFYRMLFKNKTHFIISLLHTHTGITQWLEMAERQTESYHSQRQIFIKSHQTIHNSSHRDLNYIYWSSNIYSICVFHEEEVDVFWFSVTEGKYSNVGFWFHMVTEQEPFFFSSSFSILHHYTSPLLLELLSSNRGISMRVHRALYIYLLFITLWAL